MATVVVVDAANVMGSRPDGWWKDRAGAAVRLHTDLVRLAERGDGEVSFVLVLEGAARGAMAKITATQPAGTGATPPVRVVLAAGSGDDTIVDVARELDGHCVVVTADRELRRRCEASGATVHGPSWLLGQFRQLACASFGQTEISGRPTRSAGRPTSPLAPAHYDAGCRIVAGRKPCPPGFAA
jgi:hypothetical protein